MDDFLQTELDRIFTRHRVPLAARTALRALLEKAFDDRLQFTQDLRSEPWEPPPAVKPSTAPAFEDLGRLAIGGMGEVRRVRETVLGRTIAMKILREGHDPGQFLREAQITASLTHPGVLPLYSFGRLPDGRPFFTLQEAEGQTLREALDEPQGRSQRRLLDALRRVAETVASAHAGGLVHRDLKPENILLGAFGAVWVLDWGISGPAGEVLDSVSGSPRYMAPEQVRRGPLGPQVDVWALGTLLYEILVGRPAFPGDANRAMTAILRGPPSPPGPPIDPGLSGLVAAAMAADPRDRLADAAAFSEALGAWLDGAAARQQALETLASASALFERAAQQRARAAQRQAEATQRLAAVPTWAPPEQKSAAWDLEDRVHDELTAATQDEEQATELAQQALRRCPDLREAHQLLAGHYRARLEEAEARGDPAASRLEARLRAHDTGEQTRWLAGTGALTLVTDPPGALVRAARLLPSGRRLQPGPFESLGTTPLFEQPLARGSWLLEIRADGHHPVRYPVMIDRSALWDGVPPGGTEPWPVWLPPEGALDPNEVYVPAGWTTLGGDPKAVNPQPTRRGWVDAFAVRRFATTHLEFLAYVNRLTQEAGLEVARAEVPSEDYQELGLPPAVVYTWTGAAWELQVVSKDIVWQLDWPVLLVSHGQATTYARWMARWTQQPIRLLSSDEYEKAARGVDRRHYPWGNGFDHSFLNIAGSTPGRLRPGSVYDFPYDESVYGVRGLAGCCRHWVGSIGGSGLAESRGGAWNSGAVTTRSASSFFGIPTSKTLSIGVRLARSLGPSWGGGPERS